MHKGYALAVVLSFFACTHAMEEKPPKKDTKYITFINAQGKETQIKFSGPRHQGITVLVPRRKQFKIETEEEKTAGLEDIRTLFT